MITNTHMATNLLGVLLLAHAMVISAFLIHECAHNTVFVVNLHNARLAAGLSWITVNCYARYEELRRKHFRHHIERADIIGFDYRRRMPYYPHLSKVMAMLEWAYIPAVEIMLHTLLLILPFRNDYYKSQRKRVLSVFTICALLFGSFYWESPRAMILYPLAYILFIMVLRFMDANQHSYDLVEAHDDTGLPGGELRDRNYEYRNTYSNPISMRYPQLNLFTLNFFYHNAHHERPTHPWYRLPALHQELYRNDHSHVLDFRTLLHAYHKYRERRAFRPVSEDMKSHTAHGPDLQGIDGISFLIPI
jgi:fatty acid desaturase